MSDCTVCGQPPSVCRCRLKRPSRAVYIIRDYKAPPPLPLDLPDAKLAMRELEKAWWRGMMWKFHHPPRTHYCTPTEFAEQYLSHFGVLP